MNILDVINKKKNGMSLSKEEIEYTVKGFTSGSIPDYQMSALLMAICINKMDKNETLYLTKAMMNSGDILNLEEIKGIKVDKHSTGGVGDKTTLIVAPLLASMGVKVAKMSGRALSHTGGTVDKLEGIKGFKVEMTREDFIKQVNEIGVCVAGQTSKIAPADKKIYALRDVTSTVDNISLISSSIMSKKLASGADTIVLDVKTGTGSFAGSLENARNLAREMVEIGKGMNKGVCAVISDMNQPLGRAVGNHLEVIEAVETLKGEGEEDLRQLCISLCSNLLIACGMYEDIKKAEVDLNECIDSGKAYEKFKEFISYQGGDISYIEDTSKFELGKYFRDVTLEKQGYVGQIQCREVGMASLLSGAGRKTKEDSIDYGCGIYLYKKQGDYVEKGECIARVYASSEEKLEESVNRLKSAYELRDEKTDKNKLIYEVIR